MVLEVKRVSSQAKINLEKAIKELNTKVGKVGWFEGNKYPAERIYNGKGEHVGHRIPMPVANVAHIHEFGAKEKNIPERPFIRPTVEKNKNNWRNFAKSDSKRILDGSTNATDMFNKIGKHAVGQIKKKIENIWSPPLKESTIRARMERYSSSSDLSPLTKKKRKSQLEKFVSTKFYKPLIDTRQMISTLINVVEDE